ncbi:NAD-glutamate dehydrogenase [Hydrogenophaga crassostreae]|uniref:NAD-glutamate dehydrogenase n=1 Tax=Hydrogenophaga crassostreae TaxID=1763535 RepID=A0A162W3X8_9BURK|nr:NAD-glutamate dehydrogenase [Hydrogenophaga crassostreae]AOW14290.1 NAD-glutamate dehydrogenase [Hydrogenophaga crassostreae]OAD43687.1 NAD-glutamate dehydrogenase [Hydrogenophaga crassostreae]
MTKTPMIASFQDFYFADADPDELNLREPTELKGMAEAHWALLQDSKAGEVRVKVFKSAETQAEGTTVVQIVHPDMAFLVDSVSIAVNQSGRTVHWILHPLLRVTRDAGGLVANIDSAARTVQSGANGSVVSCMLVECNRLASDPEGEALCRAIESTLQDVRSAVQDWRGMLSRLQLLSASFTALDSPEAAETKAFLSWLEQGHFTFLGAQDFVAQGDHLSAVPGTALGILKNPGFQDMPEQVVAPFMNDPRWLLCAKATRRASVHRPTWLDTISVKRLDAAGNVVGESRFLGLYTSAAHAASVENIPVVRQHVAHVTAQAGVVKGSHAHKALQSILETYPRDEILQIDAITLAQHAIGILRLQERQRVRLFLRRGPFGRVASILVYVPRDLYTTEMRVKLGHMFTQAFAAETVEFTPMLTDSALARIHYIVRSQDRLNDSVDMVELEAQVAQACKRWEDGVQAALMGQGVERASQLGAIASGFPSAYREAFGADVAADDAAVIQSLNDENPLALQLYVRGEQPHFKTYATQKVILSDALPVLESMGARVLDEHPYLITMPAGQGGPRWMHDWGLQLGETKGLTELKPRFEALFQAVWRQEVECDALNRLVLSTTMSARDIAVLRAYSRYFKQLGFAFSQSYIEDTLNGNPAIAQALAILFAVKFDPALENGRADAVAAQVQAIEAQLADVASLEQDRVLRQFVATMGATVRTNAYQTGKDYMSFKLKPREIPNVPEPRPMFEIWVYSPRVEGVHLRGGKVARGGLRWSDRRDDFRTEILGLVKAQQVKNTVIVPVGSKGGFVLKKAPSANDREAFMAEGVACYKTFLSGLLDVTDNLVKGTVVPPLNVVRHDEDDPYLVVAADKGTATFSDIANGVSEAYGFWLGDAFASGGSVGYDHKKMGITARGAWESVKRHFRGLGVDTQTQPFTVAGIGDMSGDVFGNGMLLSTQIKLVLAFDHRHVFIDPTPDVVTSYAERQRLFKLPRSSWDDYDKGLISEGGGVFSRSAKSIPLSAQAQAVLGTDAKAMAPNDLLNAILKAPVDLLYNGGIGTYVKANFETHAQVGDKAGDAFRVNGNELRCKVFGEGGNLGATQNGRIEFAQAGGLIYTDAIDNSAGVDCSDHEVNIKILVGAVQESGALTQEERNELLASMTEEVGLLVLRDNYYQSQQIELAAARPLYLLEGQQNLMRWLESIGLLKRDIEYLPTDEELAKRKRDGKGLTRPENAVLMAYSKLNLFDELCAGALPDDPFYAEVLQTYFPQALNKAYPDFVANHALKREIVATTVTNAVVNRMGATFVNYLATEASCNASEVVSAYTLAREVFGLENIWDRIDELDGKVPTRLQLSLLAQLSAVTQRASRWMLRHRGEGDLPSMIARYQPAAAQLRAHIDQWLPVEAREQWQSASNKLVEAGVDAQLAEDLTVLDHLYPVLDLVDVAAKCNSSLEKAARIYFGVDHVLDLGLWRTMIAKLPTDTLWQTQARGSARDDAYSIASQIVQYLLGEKKSVEQWEETHSKTIARVSAMRESVAGAVPDLAPVSVALRELRQLV